MNILLDPVSFRNLCHVVPKLRNDPIYQLWKCMPKEKKERILDHAMCGHRVVLGCDLDDRLSVGQSAYMGAIFVLVSRFQVG